MTRKLSYLVICLGLLGSNAWASKARLLTFGESTFGSQYIDDQRNIHLNAAEVNNYKDFVMFEWGTDSDNAAGGSAVTDTNATPRADGGYIAEANNLVYGLWFGNESQLANTFRNNVSDTLKGEDNKFEFFIGGDAGIQWGLKLGISQTEDEANDEKSNSFDTGLGVISGNTKAYANIAISNTAEIGTTEFDGKLGVQLGVIQKVKDYDVYLDLIHSNFDFTNATNDSGFDASNFSADTADGEYTYDTIKLGAGKVKSLNEKAKVFSKLEIDYTKTELKYSSPVSTTADTKTYNLPVTVGIEFDAKSWLVLRGSISQSLYSQSEDSNSKKSMLENTTVVNTGFGLVFDGFVIDTFLGSSSTDSLESRVSATYNF
ncbi:MAG: hypothetical protein H6621_12925 [Halobacteriovoraceae bacterium]|nr:hypothetical protein [Halobacteriovoraceae bacterium]MCB9095965.1 hypothetical protein [Halobacteriovoraceae bacterium]